MNYSTKNYSTIGRVKLYLPVLLSALCCSTLYAQQLSFKKLSRFEKRWVVFHPFAALTVKKYFPEMNEVYQQVKQTIELDSFENGGKLDAFRHTYTMAFLAQKIKPEKIRKLGIAHEKGNRLDFIKKRREEGEWPDSVSCAMDLQNNELGIKIAAEWKVRPFDKQALKNKVVEAIKAGKACYIKRNTQGNYISCTNEIILPENWKDKWNVPKCLVPTSL